MSSTRKYYSQWDFLFEEWLKWCFEARGFSGPARGVLVSFV